MPFDTTLALRGIPDGAHVSWLQGDAPIDGAADADQLVFTASTPGIHQVAALLELDGEQAFVGPVSIFGATPLAVIDAAVDSSGAELPIDHPDALPLTGARLVVPEGALPITTRIVATYWKDLSVDAAGDDRAHVLDLQPHGTTFEQPISLWLPTVYDERELPCELIDESMVLTYDIGGETEIYLPVEVDCATRSARFELYHFSPYFQRTLSPARIGDAIYDGMENLVEDMITAAGIVGESAPRFVESSFEWGCRVGVPVDAEDHYCEGFKAFQTVRNEVTTQVGKVEKLVDYHRTAKEIMAAFFPNAQYDAEEIETVLQDSMEAGSRVTIEAALAHTYSFNLAIHRALNDAADPQQGFMTALELFNFYRQRDQRWKLVRDGIDGVLKYFSARSAAFGIAAQILSVQLSASLDVVEAWDDRQLYNQYNQYKLGRDTNQLRWSERAALPIPFDRNDEQWQIEDRTGAYDPKGWFRVNGHYPSSLSEDEGQHWAIFEALYQLQKADTSALEKDVRDALLLIQDAIARRALEAHAQWVWDVETSPEAAEGPIHTAERDVTIHVELRAGDELNIDLTDSAGTPEYVLVRRHAGEGFSSIVESQSYAGRKDFISVGPFAEGLQRVEVRSIFGAVGHLLRIEVDVVPNPPPVAVIERPFVDHPLWSGAAFKVELTGTDAEDENVFCETLSVFDAAGELLSTHPPPGKFESVPCVRVLTLPAGEYLLEAAVSDPARNLGRTQLEIHVQSCDTGDCSCGDRCTTIDVTRCTETAQPLAATQETCRLGSLGCLEWGSPVACDPEFCAPGGTVCGSCDDDCTTVDAVACADGLLTTCTADVYGCLHASQPTVCDSAYCYDDATCGSCGDGVCDAGTEDCGSCPGDCATGCGDGCCLGGEDFIGCPADCSCTPTTCEAEGFQCGTQDNSCNATMDCGPCGGASVCDVDGICRLPDAVHPFADTGQLGCYDAATSLVCADPASAFYGQDAQFGVGTLAFQLPGDGTVLHQDTGLVWQATPAENVMWASDACDAATTGGFDDWRVPSVKELLSILDYDSTAFLNGSYFVAASEARYWASESDGADDLKAWTVDTSEGTTGAAAKTTSLSRRCVRGQITCQPACLGRLCGADGCGGDCAYCDGSTQGCDADVADCVDVSQRRWPWPAPTGQSYCYDASGRIACPSGGEAFYGQDAQFSGDVLALAPSPASVVDDPATGLQWQRLAPDVAVTYAEADAHCSTLLLDGGGWRLPEIQELIAITDYDRFRPAIDERLLPGTAVRDFWSATADASTAGSHWRWQGAQGTSGTAPDIASGAVRCVRGFVACTPDCSASTCGPDGCGGDCGYCTSGSTCAAGQCQTSPAGMIPPVLPPLATTAVSTELTYDNITGLTWQRTIDDVDRTWSEASSYCAALQLGGGGGWRLPSIQELVGIVDYSRYSPALHGELFPNTGLRNLWSATPSAALAGDYWFLATASGTTAAQVGTGARAVRCVHD